MSLRSLSLAVVGSIFVLAFTLSASAQMALVRGVVKMQKDGASVPVADAIVEPVRVDTETGKAPPAKTNKNGEFTFAGLSMVSKYVLAVSAPGASPTISSVVRGGSEGVEILLSAGDGKRLSEVEVRELVKRAAAPDAPQTSAEQKKAQEDYDKQVAKYNEEKAKTENTNKIVNDSLKAGEAAFLAKDFSGAIAKFDEGIAADPNYEGSAPVLLNYRGVAYKSRAFDAYQRSTKADADAKKAELEKAKADFTASIDSFEQGLKILEGSKSADANLQASIGKVKNSILTNEIESYRLIVRTKADTTRAKDAIPVYDKYFAVETDAAKKAKARLDLGDMLREAGESEPAIAAYRAVLETSPDNPDAMAGLGLSLFNVGVVEDDKAKMQEGMNIMQKFADTAPETHPLKQSVKEAVDYLKTEQKMTPQKPTTTRRRP